MLNSGLLFRILMYLDIFSLNNIKNINKFTSRIHNNNKYYRQLKYIYDLDIDMGNTYKNMILSSNKYCFICNEFIDNKKVLILHNILPKIGKCFLCYTYNCDCAMYLYGHEKCLKNFEEKKMNKSKIKYFMIKSLSEYSINGLSI